VNHSDDRFRQMIDEIPALAWSCLPDGSGEFLNKRWLEYTGLFMEAAVGWRSKTLVHPDDLDKLSGIWNRRLASGDPGEVEARLRRFDGRIVGFCFARFLSETNKTRSCAGTGKGSSEPLRRVLAQAAKAASTDSTILILCGTGTGKEPIARAIHRRSKRSTGALIRVNCAAISPWYIGYGTRYEEKNLKALPPGSFYTEPSAGRILHALDLRTLFCKSPATDQRVQDHGA
jgi:PAS domain S-box-containing protein